MKQYKPIRYSTFELRQVVWRFKDIEEIPEGFTRDLAIKEPKDLLRFDWLFEGLTHERFVVFVLNTAGKVQAVDIVSEGILNASLVHPRGVFRSALLGAGNSIIIAHNHPSGNPSPSQEDIATTRRMVDAGKLLGIAVQDHIIFAGRGQYTSLVELGLIQ